MGNCYGAAPTEGQRSLVNDQEGLGVKKQDVRRRFATKAYPKVRARVLIRHKRLYLVCTQEIIRYLSYPEPAYVSIREGPKIRLVTSQ